MNTEETKDPTCEDRIDQKLADTLEALEPYDFTDKSVLECARYLKEQGEDILSADIDEIREQCADHYRYDNERDCLSISKTTCYEVLMSWGGPSDFFKLFWDGEDWTGGEYHFQDWFDGARRTIDAETAARVAEHYGIYPDCEV